MNQACRRSVYLSLLILAECTTSILCWNFRETGRSSLISAMRRAVIPLSRKPAISRLILDSSSSYNGDKDLNHDKESPIRSTFSRIVPKIRNPATETELERLQKENEQLREALEEAQNENENLRYESYNKIVLETFEGERKLKRDDEEVAEDTWMTMSGEEMLTDDSLWCDELEDGSCPIEPAISFGEALRDRAYWLVGLLVLQSCSGIILARNEALLENHPVIIYFLTMLVGAGGNAGNQASVRVIRGLALGTLNENTQSQFLTREFKMACALSSILSLAGFLRAAAFRTPIAETIAVTSALAMIVFSSICLGAVLPLILKRIGVDPAHSSTTIQVLMDILGVVLAVVVSSLILDSPLGQMVITRLSGITS